MKSIYPTGLIMCTFLHFLSLLYRFRRLRILAVLGWISGNIILRSFLSAERISQALISETKLSSELVFSDSVHSHKDIRSIMFVKVQPVSLWDLTGPSFISLRL